jgi:hypothetical protein
MNKENSGFAPCHDNYIKLDNLQSALILAEQKLAEIEKKIGPNYMSAFRAGLKENIKQLQLGNSIRIVK